MSEKMPWWACLMFALMCSLSFDHAMARDRIWDALFYLLYGFFFAWLGVKRCWFSERTAQERK